MTVVYIDSVFLLNGLMDYLLLLATARLAGIPLRRRRYLLAALTGGLYAAAVFFPGCGFLASGPVKLAAGVLLALIALAAGGIWFIYHFRKQWPLMDKLASWIDGTLVGFKSFKDVRYKGRFVFYSVMVWLTYAAMCWCVFQAVPALEHLNFADALFISSVGSLSSLVPVPGGFGAYHYLVALAISTIYGASWETGILFATLNHESRALLLLVLGGLSSISSQIERKK